MRTWAKALTSAVLLALLYFIVPWHDARDAALKLPPRVWIGVLGGFLCGHAIGVVKWRLFVNATRAGLTPIDAVLCYSAGLFANLVLPTIVGGDLLRISLVANITRQPVAALWGGVMDRLTDITALALLMAAGALLARRGLNGRASEALTIALIVGVATLALVLVSLQRPLNMWPRFLRRPVGRTLVGVRQLRRRPGTAVVGLTLSLAVQSIFVVLNAWVGYSIGIDISLATWFFAWPLAKIAALIPISLGGLAVRETSLAALLVPFGVPVAISVVCALIWQSALIAGGLLAGLIWLMLHRVRHIAFRAEHGRVVVTRSNGT